METQHQKGQSTPSATALPTPILTLPRNITIRHYHPNDAASLSHNANNRAIWNNLRNRMPHPYLKSNALDWITHCNDPANAIATGPYTPDPTSATTTNAIIAGSGPKMPVNFSIVISGMAVGSIGLDFGSPGDVYARCAEVGYWLGQDYWGQGVMRIVVPAFVQWAWRTFGVLVRLEAEVNESNVGSRRALERAGLVVEGRLKKKIVKNGVLRDALMLGMLRPEGVEVV